jgi:hypothetical protein
MRRTLFCALLSVAAVALVPASAMARGHHRAHHHKRHHHARIHDKRFGTVSSSPSSPGTPMTPPSDTAGTIASFDGTTLVLTLNDGSSVSGKVTSDTEIECMSASSSDDMFQRNDNGGDHGDDQGGDQGDDQGGDHGEDGAQNCTTADLKPGATVTGAELKISSAGSVWDKVDLVLP